MDLPRNGFPSKWQMAAAGFPGVFPEKIGFPHGQFPGEFSGSLGCAIRIPRRISRGIRTPARKIPWEMYREIMAHHPHFPGNSPGLWLPIRQISREIYREILASHPHFPGNMDPAIRLGSVMPILRCYAGMVDRVRLFPRWFYALDSLN